MELHVQPAPRHYLVMRAHEQSWKLFFGAPYPEALRLKRPNDAPRFKNQLYRNLGHALFQKGLVEGSKGLVEDAIAAYREAIQCMDEDAESYCNLGLALMRQGEFRTAL